MESRNRPRAHGAIRRAATVAGGRGQVRFRRPRRGDQESSESAVRAKFLAPRSESCRQTCGRPFFRCYNEPVVGGTQYQISRPASVARNWHLMDIATTILTLLSVIVHSGFGCCAHHAHEPASMTASSDSAGPFCQCRHHAPIQDSSSPKPLTPGDHRDDQSQDCSDHCAWLTASKTRLPAMTPGYFVGLLLDDSRKSVSPVIAFAWPALGTHPRVVPGALRAVSQVWRL